MGPSPSRPPESAWTIMALSAAAAATINDLPDVILSSIFALISDTRARNSLSLVCRKYRSLERATRRSLALRGNARNLHLIPRCFGSVTDLDLSLLSPWGHALLSPSASSLDPQLLAYQLRVAFPSVASLTVYARSASALQLLAPQWPGLRHVKLVRWHQRPQAPAGADFVPLLEHCRGELASLDLSEFYHWTEDLPPVLQAFPDVAKSLTKLDLLTTSFSEGFKDHEILTITRACPNLKQLYLACMFGPRYIGSVGDEVLLAIASNCPNLRVLHLNDTSSLSGAREDPDDVDAQPVEDARISRAALIDFFSGLRFLEELVMDVCKNVRDSGLALEVLGTKCPRLRALKLGQFHGICLAVESRLDGIALCHGLESLSIKNSEDLNDMRLIEIARGCSGLAKFHVHGCKGITPKGMSVLAYLLRSTLIDVGISGCENIDAAAALQALEPIRDRIQRLHIDCIWDGSESLEEGPMAVHGFDLNELDDGGASTSNGSFMDLYGNDTEQEPRSKKKCKQWSDADCSYAQSNGHSDSDANGGNGSGSVGVGVGVYGNGSWCKSWERLKCLSLWIPVGELLTPLPYAGLEDCPNLEEIRIKVEGDCRGWHKPKKQEFGLKCLHRYPELSKMKLDCSDTIGFTLTAPSGQMDLSLWERFFLRGIGELRLERLDYWPPQDRDVNQRSLSLPGAGLLAECISLRKLFIHGTAHEHFLNFFLRFNYLRDVQLREDYYPAPEDDMSTEMRVESWNRFEDALNRRPIPD